MKLQKFKRKCILLSVALILAGAFISIAGFGMAGFSYNHLKKNAAHDAWYQTFHVSNDNLWYGVDLGGNIHLLSIGDAE